MQTRFIVKCFLQFLEKQSYNEILIRKIDAYRCKYGKKSEIVFKSEI